LLVLQTMLVEERFWLAKTISILLILLQLPSCSAISSVGALAGNLTTSSRGLTGSVEDSFLKTKIVSKISTMSLKNFTNIHVSVSDGKVLLIGKVFNNKERLEIIKNVWKIDGVENIYNEIEIGETLPLIERAEDIIFETKIKNRLLFTKGIYSNNYNIDVVEGKVYIMGIASSLNEKNTLENLLNEMHDIKKIILFIDLPKNEK